MDLTILIFLVLFVVACFSLFLVYKFGIKEKSYEEALAEQRQQTSALLGNKIKPKEKKNKKASKKSKEKTEKNELEEVDNNENKENNHPAKPHVEFKEETEEVPMKQELDIPAVKEAGKPKKVKKIRPILLNKKEKSPARPLLEVVETPIANHFEENPPKDDFELLRANSKEDIFKQEPVKEKVTKEKKQNTEPSNPGNRVKKNAKPPADIPKTEPVVPPPEEKVVIEVISATPPTNGVVVGNTGKEKKKKKSEFNTRQQLTAERDGLINSVRKAELSKTEIQLLIDLLLNKQLEAPAIIDDWSEGKSDPIQKLKKQLAEKEKLLAEEQQALVGAQAKLREIRSEQQAEKAQLQQKIRGLEEAVQTKHIEIQAANNRFQVKTQQLQEALNAEIKKNHKVLEDNAGLQMQVKQYEVNLAQIQDTENIIGKLRCDIEELSAQNVQLQQIVAEKDLQQQHFMMQISNVEKGYKDSHQEMERNLEMALRQESEWKREIANLNSALQKQFEEQRKLEHTLSQLNDQLRLSNNEKAQLKSDLQQTKDELNQLSDLSEGKNSHEVELLNVSNELSSARNELSSRIEELQQTERKFKTELETSNKKYLMAQKELEEQKSKNNELRTKNWKVMEALNAAENKTNKQGTNNMDVDVKKITSDIVTKEQESQKQFMQRLFPEIEELKSTNANDWQDKYAQLIRDYVVSLKELPKQSSVSPLASPPPSPQKSSELAKLQAQILHYKNTIDDTERMLNKLQKHVEEEEMNWRSQLAAKEAELEHFKEIKESRMSQLQTKLVNVENELSKEVEEKQALLEECQLLKSQKPQNGARADSTATIEKLSEEVNRLREQLTEEQTKNGDIGVCLKTQNCNNSTNGPAFIEVPGVRNANICSNMGCQFLYCDGNSCGSNL